MADDTTEAAPVYGVMAEFRNAPALLHAAERAYREGYRRLDAFSPLPVHGLAEAMGHTDKKVQRSVLAGGVTGAMPVFAVLLDGDDRGHRRHHVGLRAQRRRSPAEQLAGLHRADLRDHDSLRGDHGRW